MDINKYYEKWFQKRLHSKPSISKRILFNEVFRKIVEVRSSKKYDKIRLLDVGCGAGHFISLVAGLNDISIKGIDITENILNYLKKLYISIEFEHLDFSEEHILKNDYDIITAIEVIEHVPYKKQETFIENCYNSLKDDGVLIMTTPNKDRAHRIPKRFQNTQPVEDWLGIQDIQALLSKWFKNVIIETCIWYFPNRYMDAVFKRLFYPFHLTLEQTILRKTKLGGNILASSYNKKV